VTLEELNRLDGEAARAALERCCGAGAWVERMVAGRPYRNATGLLAAAERAADKLRAPDWLEAFAHHPRIGDRAALATAPAGAGAGARPAVAAWAGDEQRGAAAAADATLEALVRGNRAYEQKFGYIFIVCATGKSAEEMLALLEARLGNDPDTELVNAAREQRAITRLRLEKLLAEPA
jgi:2-oxo-4-hydroxy-4-carboxy-5-ureidoimidazoline decarboxylase